MKKITILAAVVALLGSCAQNTEDTINPNTKAEGRTIYATFDNEEEETKTYVENYKYLRWHAGDEISFFDATTHNSQYAFAGNDGDAEGEFDAVATGEGTAIATTYGVYPYNANTSISEEGVISVELPSIQAYGVNSFGKGANTMVAVGESATDDKLFFKNACGYLVVKLYNESSATVKSVVLKGNDEENIAGAATITATHTGIPSVTMADTATTSVTIDCGEGVEIGTTAETATEFWFALPEITFEGGITITVTAAEGVFEKMTTKPVTITRNDVQPMKALSCKFVIPETWKIYYTATSKVTPYNKYGFGANVVSNTYQDNQGIIVFDSDVTSIGERAFYESSHLNSITIPNSVSTIDAYAFCRCSNLTDVSIGDNVNSISVFAFSNCSNLTHINIPNSVSSIGANAFYECYSLKSATIGSSVTSIGDYAFYRCSGLTSVTIGNNVTSIGDRVFEFCSSLTDITIPDNVMSIGENTFANCI
ncbi:MAG: leucine-rich repeat domain-containing protein [Tidjanibacter sp.]|nr:leucine-rich repeat domain-containing protein [Tidjanibacter sp.]